MIFPLKLSSVGDFNRWLALGIFIGLNIALPAFATVDNSNDIAVIDRALAAAPAGATRVMFGDCGLSISQLQTFRARLVAEETPRTGPRPLAVTPTSSVFTPWPGGVIPYRFDPTQVSSGTLTTAKMQQFRNSTGEWEAAANVQFVEFTGTTPANFITVQENDDLGGGESTAVGMQGGEQFLQFGAAAWNRGTCCHEMGHALGYIHEQQRDDRDTYVIIDFNNIPSGQQANFTKLPGGAVEYGAYDFYSVMEYSRNALAIDPTQDTITMQPAYAQYANIIGNVPDRTLSTLDRAGMASIYGNPSILPGPIVTNTNDSGPGSLRSAIYYAFDQSNLAPPVATTISFQIPKTDPNYNSSTGVFTITPTYEEDAPGNGTTIDATTETSFVGVTNSKGPAIVLDGSLFASYETIGAGYQPAFILRAANCTVKGFDIHGFDEAGIQINTTAGTGNVVSGCYIGTDPTGTTGIPNAVAGIYIHEGASNNTIGGTTTAARNIISGNTDQGVVIVDAGTNGNVVEGNYIGLNPAGTGAVGNGLADTTNNYYYPGVGIFNGAQSNIVGGTATGSANVISGNAGGGVSISGAGSNSNLVEGNLIGTNAAGSAAVANGNPGASGYLFPGIDIFGGSASNTIGGVTTAARNVISGNGAGGVFISNVGSISNVVEGNYIGTDITGAAAIANGTGVGIFNSASSNTIGGTATGTRNVIAGNTDSGIAVGGPDSGQTVGPASNIIQGNYVGLNATGAVLGNGASGYAGVEFYGAAQSNTLGGLTAAARNVISGNGGQGVYISDVGTTLNVIEGNYVGTNLAGTAAIANNSGVTIYSGAANNTIGGTASGARNIISGNTNQGIVLAFVPSGQTVGPNNNLVQGNYIGLGAAGAALGNGGPGVDIFSGAQANTIGGTTAAERNVISDNADRDVGLSGTGTNANVVEGNYVGLDPTGVSAIGASSDGFELFGGAQNNIIGGTVAGSRNYISGHSGTGISISGSGTTGTLVEGNTIGQNVNGTAVPNAAQGIAIFGGADSNTIGGTATGAGNIIADNTDEGIALYDNTDLDDTFSENSIYGNSTGIALYSQSNNSQAAPTLTAASGTSVSGSLSSTASTTYRLEFFSSPSGNEGQTYLGSASVSTNSSGAATFTASLTTAVSSGQVVTATATDPSGDTSQFSTPITATGSSGGLPGIVTTQPATSNSDQATLTWTAVNGATSYTVGRSTVSGGPYTTVSSGSASTTFTDTNLTDGVTYYYVVAGVNGSGTGPNSTQVVVTPTAQNLFWDTTTAAGLANGNGTWDTATTAKWSNSSAGTSNPLLVWYSDDNAFFQTAGTLTATIGTSTTVKTGSLTQATAGTALTVSGGTLQIDSNAGIVDATGTNHSLIVNSALVLNSPNITIDNEETAGSTQLLGVISETGGSRALTKIGTGTLTLGTVANTFSGGVTLAATGQVVFSNNASFGTGPITFNAGTSLTSTAQIYTASTSSAATLANNIAVTPGSFGAYTGAHTLAFGGNLLAGTGTFSIAATTSAASVTLSGDNHAFNGTLVYNDNGTTPLLLGSTTAGSSSAIWTLTGGSTKGIGAGAATLSLGELTSATGIGRLYNSLTTGTATFQIGDATTNAPSYGGIIADGTAGGKSGVTKTGADNQILTGASTYTGPTVISGGALTVNGSLAAASTVTVGSGGTLAGTGKINGATTLSSGGILSPGGSATVGQLTLAGALNLSGGGMANFDLATPTSSDLLALTGTYAAPSTGTVTINLNALSGFGAGTYPLITGATGISATSFTLGTTPSGFTYQLSATGGSLSVIVSAGTSGSLPGIVTTQPATSNSDQATLTWTAVSGATSYTVGRSTVSGGPYTTVSSGSASTTFTDTNLTDGVTYYYVVAGVNGSGTGPNSTQVVVTPTAQNLYWDTTTASGLANGSGTWDTATTAKWSNSSAGTSNPLLVWYSDDNAFFQTAGTLTASIGTGTTVKTGSLTQATAGTALTVSGGTLQIDSNAGIVDATGTNHSLIVNSALVLNSPNITIDNEETAGSTQLLGVISETGGSRALTKIGTGTLTLGTVANTFSGGVTLAATGQVAFSNNASFGTGPITFNAGTSLTSTAQIYTASTSSAATLANNIAVTPGSFGAYTGAHTLAFGGNLLAGTGTFSIAATTSAASVTLSGDNHAFNGTLVYNDNGTTPLLLGSTTAGSSSAIWTLTGGSTKGIGAGAATLAFGELTSATGIGRLYNSLTTGTATFQIGDATTNAPSYGGIIADGTAGGKIGVTKTGADNQILTGASTYTGPTVISGGALTVNGSLAAGSTVTVGSGGTLAGTGKINGATTLASGGILAPGGSGTVGQLTLAGALNLSGGGMANFDLATPTSSDLLALTGTYAAPSTGTVTINLNGLSGFGAGTYPLITGATGISATSFTLGTTPSGFSYQLSAGGGTLSVVVSTGSSAPAAPTGLAAVAANAEVDLAWNASTGATSYNLLRGSASGGPYAITVASGLTGTTYSDTGLTNGTTYYYVVTATNSSGTSGNSNQAVATPNTTTVDSYWFDNDIGNVGVTGNASYSAGTFTLNGSGAGVSGTADSLDYTYQTLVGDGTIIAQVATQSAGASGVMMCETLSSGARVVAMVLQAGTGAVFQDRVATGGSAATGATTSGIAVPYWVKLARVGNNFTGYTSPDGVTWTQVGAVTDTMATSIDVGLAQSSLNNSALASAGFSNVSIVPSAAWASQDIGAVPIVGASYYSNGVATVQGTGASLYNGSDQFRYTYQTVSGDCDITARVASQTNTNTAAKAGVMIRAGLTATAAHALVYVTPSSGIAFEYRLTTGGNAANTTPTYGIKAPYWVRLVRSGNLFTAYRSPDGTTWTTIGSETITMSTTVYIGLPVCSYNTTTPCTATFDNITLDP